MGGHEQDPAPSSWPSFLRGESADQILARLSNGDPLRLTELTARRLRERWFMLEPDRVCRRAFAVCAEAAAVEDPPSDLEAWVRAQIDRAIAQLVGADAEAERRHPERVTADERNFPLLTECLYLEPESVRRCSVAFNRLDPLARRAFFELLIEGREAGHVIEAGPWDADGLYSAIHAALAVFDLELPLDAPAHAPAKEDGP